MARIKKTVGRIGIAICIAIPAVGLIALTTYLAIRGKRKRNIYTLVEKNRKHLAYAQIDEAEFLNVHMASMLDLKMVELEEAYLGLLHEFYIMKQEEKLAKMSSDPDRNPQYISALRRTNHLEAFKEFRLTSLAEIKHRIDEKERQKAETKKKNTEFIDAFLLENESRIVHAETREQIHEALMTHCRTDKIASQNELEETFVAALASANFRWEVGRFIDEHSDQASGQYFNREAFYQELSATDNFRNYQYSNRYDNSWMLPLLVMHVANREQKHKEELRRREEAERRRREEEERRRREAEEYEAIRSIERMRSNNSSFGGGFGGGSSSGGGFKGGW